MFSWNGTSPVVCRTFSTSEQKTGEPAGEGVESKGKKGESTLESQDSEIESLLASLAEKDVEIEEKQAEVEKLKDGLLRSYAEMENLRDRTKREVDSSKKFAVQSFAKDLLDVGDNLARAVSVVPEKYRCGTPVVSEEGAEEPSKILNSLLEGVSMTEQQMLKVFSRHGLKRFEPLGEVFDPNVHNALFEVPDPQKTPGTVAVVTKVGYMLHDRVIRPAEVGVVRDPSA